MADSEVMDTVTLSLILALRHKRMQKKTKRDNLLKPCGVRWNKNLDEIPVKSWIEAKKLCEAIRAGRHIAGKQAIGSILAD